MRERRMLIHGATPQVDRSRSVAMKFVSMITLGLCLAAAQRLAGQGTTAPEFLFRLDDVGMNRSVNAAVEKVAATGMPFSVSVLVVGPQWEEAVQILKRNPQISVGVHLALNSEWRDYRWGPVLGRGAVHTIVDSSGNFRASVDEFLGRRYDIGEIEQEISAQIEKAKQSGLTISYVDAHMGLLESTPELREVYERVARRYNLGVSRRFGEAYTTLWSVPPAEKKARLLARLTAPKPDSVNLIVFHVAERTAEMQRLVDMNAPAQNSPGAGVAAHRSAELEAILSREVAEQVRAGGIRLITYGTLIGRRR